MLEAKLRMTLRGSRMVLGSPRFSRCATKHRTATRFALGLRAFANGVTFWSLITFAAASSCFAGELSISVLDMAGHPVSDVVVNASSLDMPTTPSKAAAVMDQRQLAFVPSIVVVAVGTSVEFPNSDSVSHQVYSFSPAKKFQLPLYKGDRHPPVIFEREGLVVLGCNIHDHMVGYIYVTSAPLFGKTDASGTLRFRNLKAGAYQVTIWSPFIADPPTTLARTVRVDAPEVLATRFQLARPLRTHPQPGPRRGDWEY
jgi:plastocyanin